MPATKPTKLPRWATSANANTTEPNEGKKDAGMYVAERPPATYFNWLFNLIHSWLAWLNDFEAVAHTWTALQTFAGGLAVTGNIGATGDITAGGKVAATGNLEAGGGLSAGGDLTVGGQANINSALVVTGEVDHSNRLKSGAPINATDLKLVVEHPGYGIGAGSVRRYVVGNSTTLALVETINAMSEEGTWFREIADQPAYLIRLSQAGFRVLAWPVGEATAFARELRLYEAGMKWTGVGTGAADANPPATAAVANELRAANTPKAWGALQVNADNSLTILDGFNVASIVQSDTSILVTFASPMADANYAVNVSYDGSGGDTTGPDAKVCVPYVHSKTASGFKVAIIRTEDAAQVAFDSAVTRVDVVVFGKQAS